MTGTRSGDESRRLDKDGQPTKADRENASSCGVHHGGIEGTPYPILGRAKAVDHEVTVPTEPKAYHWKFLKEGTDA